MNKNHIWTFVVILVLGVLYITFIEKGTPTHVFEYMSAISLVFIATTLMHIAIKKKKK